MATWRNEKRRYKQYEARKEQLPASYREAIDAVREIVGDDPVRFTVDFLRSYPANPWAGKEQQRLAHTVDAAERAEA